MPRDGQDRLLRAALKYTAHGWSVFPIKPRAKEPLTAHGFKDATGNEDQIRTWWTRRPEANIGVATGTRSGILVLDADGSEGDRALVAMGVEVPTLTSITARGRHLYFVHAPGIGCSVALCTGLDVRGDGGYVVAPPSVHESGFAYQWDEEHFMGWGTRPAPLPESLHQILLQSRPPPRASASAAVILEGHRNDGLTRLAGSVAASARTREEVLEQVIILNAQRCVPPLPRREVEGVVRSIWQRECKNRKGDPRPRRGSSLKQPDVNITVRWAALDLRESKGLAGLGYLLDLVRLVATNTEMPIITGHGKKRAAWVGAGTAEIATRFLCNRWGMTRGQVRGLLERWEQQGLVRRLPPRAGRKPCRVQLVEGWFYTDPTGANLLEPSSANLRHNVSPCDQSTKDITHSNGSDNLFPEGGATIPIKRGRAARTEEESRRGSGIPRWLKVGPFEVLV